MVPMDSQTLDKILSTLCHQRVAVVGDFCVDRYFHIDPSIVDHSNETGLPIHQVREVRSEPGGAANVVRNLAVLGVGEVYPVGFVGDDGEGTSFSVRWTRPGCDGTFCGGRSAGTRRCT